MPLGRTRSSVIQTVAHEKDERSKKSRVPVATCPRSHNVLYFMHYYDTLLNLQYIDMNRKKAFLPKHTRILECVGENLRLARLRRRLSAEKVAQRAGISRNTLYQLENGSPSSSIATLFRVLTVLGLEEDFSLLAKDDQLGRRLEDAKLKSPRQRAPKTLALKDTKTKDGK